MTKGRRLFRFDQVSETREASAERLRVQLRGLAPWHLDVEVRDGVRTADAAHVTGSPELEKVSFLDAGASFSAQMLRLFPEGLQGRTLLDCACNCGGYTFWARELGAGNCFGFDVREHWIKQAEFLAKNRETSSEGIRFAVCDLYDLSEATDESFDISIFKGIFYHLPDPIQGLKIVADKTKELLILNTATLAGHPDGYLAVSEEPTEALMSGVHGLNWYPTGPDVLKQILTWLGFPAIRLSFWHQETTYHGGGGSLGRLELLAARTEATFEHYDRGGARSAPKLRQDGAERTLFQQLRRVSFRVAKRVWWASPRAVRDFVRPIVFPSARASTTPKSYRGSAGKATSSEAEPLRPPDELIFVGPGDFHAIGRAFFGYFTRIAGLQPTDRVLEVGSGIGRIAIPLTDYLHDGGSFDGIEIVLEGVSWCRERITSRYPNFRFHHADIRNTQYNPGGKLPAREYVFPFADQSYDFVCLISVFTHMLPMDVSHYLDEIARVLRPGRTLFVTFNLLNEESKRALSEGRAVQAEYPFDHGIYRVAREDIPEAVVAYEESWVRREFARAGLAIDEPIRYGSWAGREKYLTRQDVIIATRGNIRGGRTTCEA